jgi:hypothetical protein
LKRSKRIRARKPKSVTVALDALLRRVVLLRDAECQMGASGLPDCSGGLQAAHVLPKGTYPAMRHDPQNVVLLCAYHHVYGRGSWHKDPLGAVEWFRERYGEDAIARLRAIADMRRKKPDPTATRLYLEAELKKLGG